jgi:hypothetical protein
LKLTQEGLSHMRNVLDRETQDVRSMLGSLAEVVREPDEKLKVTRNGQTLVAHASPNKNLY